MASKKPRPLDDPPAASSSEEEESEEEEEEEEEVPEKPQLKPQSKQAQSEEEEEESEEEEEEEEESEEEDEQEKQKKTQKQNQATPQISPNPKKNPQPESDSESDSQKSPRASDFTIKPIKSAEEKIETPVSKPSAKRRAENGKEAKSKKAKPSAETTAEEEGGGGTATPAEKRAVINRLWSEEDEIAILKGLIEFQANLGKDPSTHQQEFHDFVKKSLHVDASKSQVTDKVRRLRNKFKGHVKKSIDGEDPVFSKPHEYKSFQLSKKIWGSSNGVDDVATQEKSSVREKSGKSSNGKSSRKGDKITPVEANANNNTIITKEEDLVKGKSEEVGLNQGKEEDDVLGKTYPFLMSGLRSDSVSNMPILEFVKSNLSSLGTSDLKDLDNKWKKQNEAEIEVFLGRVELVREEARMVLDAVKSSKY